MERDNLLEAINNHLEDIREQFEIIREYEGKIPSIELDLVMSNIRKVYESFLKLEKANQPVINFHVDDNLPEKAEEKPVEAVMAEEQQPESSPEPPRESKPPVAEAEPVTEKPRPTEDMVAPPVEEKEPSPPPPVVKEEVIPEKEAEPEKEEVQDVRQPKTTLDLFGESSGTLADRLTDTSEKRVADTLKVDKIQDIKSVIGINEKFLFINELFDGSLKNYEDAIARLNQCGSGEEAGKVLEEYQAGNKWDTENPTTQSFIELVNRKF